MNPEEARLYNSGFRDGMDFAYKHPTYDMVERVLLCFKEGKTKSFTKSTYIGIVSELRRKR